MARACFSLLVPIVQFSPDDRATRPLVLEVEQGSSAIPTYTTDRTTGFPPGHIWHGIAGVFIATIRSIPYRDAGRKRSPEYYEEVFILS